MRMPRIVLISVAVLLVAMVLDPIDAHASTTWSVDNTVATPPLPNGALNAISCPSATSCVAVGSYQSRTGGLRPLIETLSAGKWSVSSSPSPANAAYAELYGVSCASATACVAVGFASDDVHETNTPIVETLHGGIWSLTTAKTPVGGDFPYFNSVSCTSATFCVAAGGYSASSGDKALLETLTGGTWKVVRAPAPVGASSASLNGVSCTSATACVAVGSANQSGSNRLMVDVLSGTTWSLQHVSLPTGATSSTLTSVSCTSATACMAVGSYNGHAGASKVLAYKVSGTTWTLSATKNPVADSAMFSGVSCASATSCAAVGSLQTGGISKVVAEVLSAGTWTISSIQKPVGTGGNGLAGVSCSSPSSCVAAGQVIGGPGLPLAESLSGTSWVITPTPKAIGAQPSQLEGVSCPSTSLCVAVGSVNELPGSALAEIWDGTGWTIESIPVPSGATGLVLWGVSCPTTTMCMAVGTYETGSGVRALADVWNGSTWTTSTTALPGGATDDFLYAVSCPTTTTCVAVGDQITSSHALTLAEKWNGTTWSVTTTQNASGSTSDFLYGVSCSSTTACLTVGTSVSSSGSNGMSETYNGTSWGSAVTTPGAGVSAVSCVSGTFCLAVGYDGFSGPLAAIWNGTSWSTTSALKPGDADSASLDGVSCVSATACTAVGSSSVGGYLAYTVAEQWNGTDWSLDTTPNAHGATATYLEDVSCAAASTCRAVGEDEVYNYVPFSATTG